MKQIIWGTDLHYNFPRHDALVTLHESVKAQVKEADAAVTGETPPETLCVIISGDTSEGHKLENHLKLIRDGLNLPVYFVCGNHDYWKKSFWEIRGMLTEMTEKTDIKWLGALSYARLTDDTAIVGHDGWYDAIHGDWQNSQFFMNDWYHIREFGSKTIPQIVEYCRESLATPAAEHVKKGVREAVAAGFKNVIIVTHVPPFKECSIYRGRPGDETTVCWYTSGIMGDALYEVAMENPDVDTTVLCGHTHNGISKVILANLTVHVGHADYGSPKFQFVGVK